MEAALLLPALLGAGAIGSGLALRHQARKLAHLLETRSSSVAELLELQATVAEQLGAGAFRERVKLTGELVCAEPLTAPGVVNPAWPSPTPPRHSWRCAGSAPARTAMATARQR